MIGVMQTIGGESSVNVAWIALSMSLYSWLSSNQKISTWISAFDKTVSNSLKSVPRFSRNALTISFFNADIFGVSVDLAMSTDFKALPNPALSVICPGVPQTMQSSMAKDLMTIISFIAFA